MIGYLKCDAKGCDHEEQIDGVNEEMIGKPCPKCGASLLTREDYEEGKRMSEFLIALYDVGLAMPASRDEGPSEDKLLISINPHGGSLNIKVT